MASKSTDGYISEEDEDYVPSEVESEEERNDYDDNNDDDLKEFKSSSNTTSLPEIPDEKKKQQIDELWEDFLKDTNTPLDCIASSSNPTSSTPVTVQSKDVKERSTKETNEDANVIVTEIFDFAGEEVRVDKFVTKTEAEKRNSESKVQKRKEPKSGLSDVIKLLSKKPKMSVLEKTGHDWKQFVDEKGIDEELKTYNRGKGGYLDKQEFLSQVDYKQFEHEKAARNSYK